MKISCNPCEHYLEVTVEGRLDATWAQPFLDALRDVLRDGRHHIRLDASALEYLSSAGIRAILQIHRELAAVDGSFKIRHAAPFVSEALSMSGFGQLLDMEETQSGGRRQGTVGSSAAVEEHEGIAIENLLLAPTAGLALRRVGGWQPWQPVPTGFCREMAFPGHRFALGIGAPGNETDGLRERLGEFVAAAGCVAYLPGDGFEAPDYLIGAEQFVPSLGLLDALVCEGEFSHLLRFSPQQRGANLSLSRLVEHGLDSLHADAMGFLVIAEIDGLVGAALSRSPGLIGKDTQAGRFPDIRDWITFCGERAHATEQALVVGVACRRSDHPVARWLPAIPSKIALHCHAHAAVFPFRPLPQGRIEMRQWVRNLFEAGEPKAILHLLEDDRPALGQGQSAFVRGACWCGPLDGKEVVAA
jgi:anti-anti-sigma factor